jgi:glycolate dehydrogenase iron-sulfur subunit
MRQTVPVEGLQKHGTTRARPSAFDAHHPPSLELIDQCVHCGFCLPACPTYQLWGQEMDSPRGRIYLMKMAAEGGVAQMDATFVSHFDRCLGCMACMPACPSGVQYSKLIEATRAQIERNYRRGLLETLFRKLIFALFPHPRRLRWLALPLWLYQRSGLRWLMRKTGALRLLPVRVQSLESILPEIHLRALFAKFPEKITADSRLWRAGKATEGDERPLRVGVLTGCVQRVFFSEVNAATVRVLAALGCEVIVPAEQGCCGALMAHAGGEAQAEQCARKLIDVFDRADVDVIAINAAGCGSQMKEYAHLLRDDSEYAERARFFAARCRDISEVIADLLPERAEYRLAASVVNPSSSQARIRLPQKIAYHDACHLQHAQGVRVQPRQLLSAIRGIEVIELPESGTCCGSAGIYNLIEPKPALQLGDRKARHVIASGAQALVSANPGCLMQIASALKRAGHPLPVYHLVQVLDAALAPAAEQQG